MSALFTPPYIHTCLFIEPIYRQIPRQDYSSFPVEPVELSVALPRLLFQIEEWLLANVSENGNPLFKYSTGEPRLQSEKRNGYYPLSKWPVEIAFVHAEDLLAFKLKWNIHG
jgi:hypothetical protein